MGNVFGKPWFFWRLREISDLTIKEPFLDRQKMKGEIRILVVDDKTVPFLDILKNNDYQIKHVKDIEDLRVVETYDIILCDIQGVGKKLSPKHQGVHLVHEIKKHYPFKQVIAFTANPSDPDVVEGLMHKPDKFLPKDANEREWITALDDSIQKFGNPVKQWLNLRSILLSQNVSTKTVAHLESSFVKAIEKKDSSFLLKLQGQYPDVSSEMWTILGSLIGVIIKQVVSP